MDESSNSRSSSDSVDVSNMENSPPIINGHIDMEQFSDEDNGAPTLEIIEQPQQRGFRFRYECEGPSHGGLQGGSSERHRKTVPTVKIRNYNGPAKVEVSLVTDEVVPKAHAHKLVGKNCVDGVCIMDVKAGTSQISFPNLCIQHVTRKKAAEVLEQRICGAMIQSRKREIKNWSTQVTLTNDDVKKAKQEAASQAKAMQLNVVRLCFQCYLMDNEGNVLAALNSLTSDPIFDSKAPGANALKICRMDKYSGCCTGNDEVFLLCEKVQKDDIMVRFLEQDPDGVAVWEAYGHFGPFDVHRQFAIVFKTPEYRDVNIQSPVNVLVMLQRKSDGESSDPKSFTYYPRIRDKEDIDRKRRKLIPSYHHGGSGFSGMKPSIGGTGNGSNGSDANGMHNGGSIPNFDNLPLATNQFGQRPLNLNSGGRPVLQAKRTLPSFNQSVGPALYSGAATDILSHSTDFVYEEVSNLSPPMVQLQGVGDYLLEGQPQTMGVGSPSGSNMSVASPYSNTAMMAGSPQNVSQIPVSQFGAGALSPQHQLHPGSPQNNFISQQMTAGSQIQSIPVTDSVMSSIQNTQMESDLQMTINDLKIEPVSQPVQVSPLSTENLEIDFLMQNAQLSSLMNTGFGQYNEVASQFTENKNVFSYAGGYNNQPFMPCGYSARGSQDRELQDVIDVLDMVDGAPPRAEPCEDYDEVDSARVDDFDISGLTPRSGTVAGKLLEQTAKLEPGMTKAVTVSEHVNMAEPKVQPEPYTPAVEEKTVTGQPQTSQNTVTREPDVANKSGVTIETSVQAESPQKASSSAQTEMDPMLKLAIKTSEALQYYAASGDIRSLLMVQRFLMAVQDQDGDLPLHTALINQRYEVFQNILDVMVTLPDAYTRINAYNFHHQTPLHLAVITNQAHAVDLLIRAGADTTLVDRNGYTPAHLAVLYGRDDCLRNLLKYLRPGVSSKEPFPEINQRCYDGFTPVHLAAQLENLAAMKLLVYGKANVDLPDGKSGRTPLHHAVETDDLSLAAYLILQAGASVNIKRFDGNTALHIACGRGNVSMVALLMAGGADPNVENDDIVEVSDDAESDESDSQESSEEGADNDNSENKNTVSDDVDDKDTDTEKELKKKSDTQDVPDGQDVKEKGPAKKGIGKGLTPADFADCNDKILRVLNGEPYSSITESSSDSVQQVTDKMSSLRFISKDSGHGSMGICSAGGDMCRVPYSVRRGLSQMLDPANTGTDWQALADKLGMKMLMEGHLGDNSPTRVLLTLYEEGGGTVERLVQALVDLKREDCVTLLKNLVDQSFEQNQEKETKGVNKDPKYDSGVSDSYNKSYSPVHRAHIVT